VTDASRDWEVGKIIGKKDVNGVVHYLVEWCSTWEPVYSLVHASELVDEFKGLLEALHRARGQKEPVDGLEGYFKGGSVTTNGGRSCWMSSNGYLMRWRRTKKDERRRA
jgi:hypothetical protein